MKYLRSPWIRLALFACLGLAVVFALQVNWDRSYRTASGVPRSFAPFGDEIRRADGTVDYRSTLNQLLGEPPPAEQNALVVYLPLACQSDLGSSSLRPTMLRALGVSEASFAAGRTFHSGWESSGATSTPESPALNAIWKGDAEFPLIAAWLDRYQPDLNRIREATRLRWYCPLLNDDPNALLLGDLLPHIQGMRTLARMLTANCHREAGRGNSDAAIADVVAIHHLGRQIRGGLVIQNLVSIAIRDIARETAIRLLQQFALNEGQLNLLAPLMEYDVLPELFNPKASRSERYLVLDLLQQVDRNRLNASELTSLDQGLGITAWARGFWTFVDGGQALQIVNQHYDSTGRTGELVQLQGTALARGLRTHIEAFRSYDSPPATWGERIGMAFSPAVRGQLLGRYLSDSMGASLRMSCLRVLVRETQQNRLLQLAFALERYRCRNGVYPESLEQLVPELVASLPSDLFAETGSFGYEKLASGFRLQAGSVYPPYVYSDKEPVLSVVVSRPAEAEAPEAVPR